MPDGLLQWYDAREGVGRIVRRGKRYPVRASDMEPRARVPGARVHFDIRRVDGTAIATNVTLREGTRVSRRQRRFGEMAGARRPSARGTAPFTTARPALIRALTDHPEAVVRLWADLVVAGETDDALQLYAPDAVVHAGDEDLRGRHIRGWLPDSGLPGRVRSVETSGAGDLVVVRWIGPDDRPATWWARAAHGEIAEQWIQGARPPSELLSPPEAPEEPAVEVVTRGDVPSTAKEYALDKVRRALRLVDEPVLHARITLRQAPDPAVERPSRAKVTLDVNGKLLRADVAAHDMQAAIDLMDERLRDRLHHRAEREKALRSMATAPDTVTWQRPERPGYVELPPEEREVVRRKTYALEEMTVDEAVFDLDTLDIDFYLFQELATGDDAVVHRLPEDGGYGLRRTVAATDELPPTAVEVTLDPRPAPELRLEDAIEWLQVSDEPFLLFRNADTGRGNVLYRRYDGHYGLVTPADEATPPAEPSIARRRLRDELERLEAVRTALLTGSLDGESEAESVGEVATIDQHQADLGTETFERSRDLSLLEDVEAQIDEVQRALVRVSRGTYGRCDVCGKVIPDERLAAKPATRYCVEHQAEVEGAFGQLTQR
ncbi:MAG TPA: sigma 54 modulation/S30EA ribosomal C-terminal domain-containing protein [Acidimicrobiales bacterium]|nr:sigma 54 modulation/S30EA ribosomal C-terminal domain-containing protein [Acidimicrobiales bacterium]